MNPRSIEPVELPRTRILGTVTEQRTRMLACIDVVVGYVSARHRQALVGWRIEAALVERRVDFRGGETVALRAIPVDGRSPADLPPVPIGVLREMGSRVAESMSGVANVVPDVASPEPDIDGTHSGIMWNRLDGAVWIDDDWSIGAQSA